MNLIGHAKKMLRSGIKNSYGLPQLEEMQSFSVSERLRMFTNAITGQEFFSEFRLRNIAMRPLADK